MTSNGSATCFHLGFVEASILKKSYGTLQPSWNVRLEFKLEGQPQNNLGSFIMFYPRTQNPTDANSVSKCPSSATSVLRAAMVGWVFQLNGLDTGLQTSKASMQRLHHVVGPENKARCSKMKQVTAQRCLVVCISQAKRMEWLNMIHESKLFRWIQMIFVSHSISKLYLFFFEHGATHGVNARQLWPSPGEVAQELSAVLVSHAVVATEAIAWSKSVQTLFDAFLIEILWDGLWLIMANLYFSCFIQCHWDPAFALVELGFLFQRRAKEFVPATSQWIWTCTDSGNKHRPSTLLHPNQIHPTDPILVILDVKMRFVPQVRDQLWRDAVPRDHSKAGLLECFGKPSQDKWLKFQDVFFFLAESDKVWRSFSLFDKKPTRVPWIISSYSASWGVARIYRCFFGRILDNPSRVLRAMKLCLSFVPLCKAEMSRTGMDCNTGLESNL